MKNTKMKKVRINRKTWSRGEVNNPPRLCNYARNMCCLGFAVHQIAKVNKNKLVGLCVPGDFYSSKSMFTTAPGLNNEFSNEAARINDTWEITDQIRESKLIKLFKENGIILEFYN